MEKDRRRYRCSKSDCRGVIYREGDDIYCTGCDFRIVGKRSSDKYVRTFQEMKREFNGS